MILLNFSDLGPSAKCVRCGAVIPGRKPGNIACKLCRVGSRSVPTPTTIQCRICGRYFETLVSHVVTVHEITSTIYTERFPGAPLWVKKSGHSEETRRTIGEAQRKFWASRSESEKMVRMGVMWKASRESYPNGPNLGKKFSVERCQQMSLARKGKPSPTKGLKKGPVPQDIREKISASLKGKPRVFSAMGRQKLSESLWLARQEGRLKNGYGKGSYYTTPFQGVKWFRSTSEVQRARELDEAGLAWFYELHRFNVVMNEKLYTYTPDFWILPGVSKSEVPCDFNSFVVGLPWQGLMIEDVKGWWGVTHPTRLKIMAFQEQHPEVPFEIVLRQGLEAISGTKVGVR